MVIVGYILLGILILLLCILLALFFFPISYRVEGKKGTEGFALKARVKWLFGFVRAAFDLPEPGNPIVKVAFFTVVGKEKNARKKPSKHEKDPGEANTGGDGKEAETDDTVPDSQAENGETDTDPRVENGKPSTNSKAENSKTEAAFLAENHEAEGDDAPADSKNKSDKKKKSGFSLSKLKEEYDFYRELWEEEDTKPFVKDALLRVLHLLKNLFPRKIRGWITFGAASPDVTGYVYGLYCVCKSLWPKRVLLELTPDFTDQVLEAHFLVKGHFTVFTIVLDALKIWFDKRLKKIRKSLDEHKNGSGKGSK